ncbi:MAG: DMT family transporter [Mycobacterium leprae]
MERTLAILMAAVAGALMPAQGAANAWLARRSTLAMATFWTHGTAAIILAFILLLHPAGRSPWPTLLHAPLPSLLGGVMGVLITWLVAAAVAPLGMVAATTGILVAQVVTAALLDHFGIMGLDHAPFTLSKGLGGFLLLLGAWLILRK